jgi:hypothetical protein
VTLVIASFSRYVVVESVTFRGSYFEKVSRIYLFMCTKSKMIVEVMRIFLG